MSEVWKDVIGFYGIYQISDNGFVKAVETIKKKGRGNQFCPERILAFSIEKRGYLRVTLQKDKVKKYFGVHQLVATHFVENPENKKTVNHKDGDKSNNHFENLEWATNKEQINHADLIGLRNISGENSKVAKLKDSDIKYIRENYWSNLKNQTSNTKELCEKFSIGKTTLYNIIRKKTWKQTQ